MSDFIENEGPDMALNLDALSLVSDGASTPRAGLCSTSPTTARSAVQSSSRSAVPKRFFVLYAAPCKE